MNRLIAMVTSVVFCLAAFSAAAQSDASAGTDKTGAEKTGIEKTGVVKTATGKTLTEKTAAQAVVVQLDKGQLQAVPKDKTKVGTISLTQAQFNAIIVKHSAATKAVVKVLSGHIAADGKVKVLLEGGDLVSISNEPVY